MMCVKSTPLLLLSLCLPLTAVAQSAAVPAVPAAPDNSLILQRSVDKLSSEVQVIQQQIENQSTLKLFQQLQDLADEVSQLRGQIEVLNFENANLKQRQRELYLDIDRRLHELEIRGNSTTQAVPQIEVPKLDSEMSAESPTAAPEPVVKNPEPPATKSTPPAVAPAIAAASQPEPKLAVESSPAPQVEAPATTMSEDRVAYQKAFDMLKEGRYESAKTAFRSFISNNPQSPYASNAQYWLGEAHYVTREFSEAVAEFSKVIKVYPSSNKVQDAMLKLGYTFYELKQYPQARDMLSQLQKNFPGSTAARLAQQREQRMNKEGL